MNQPWTPDRIALLKALWGIGHSAQYVADQLGDTTRNAVIGKAHRLKLTVHVNPPPRHVIRAAMRTNRKTNPPARYFRSAPQPKAKPMPMEPAVKPEARMLSLLDLQAHECKWPIGDPRHDGFGFCGAKSDNDRPYCRYHGMVAYRPVEVRVR